MVDDSKSHHTGSRSRPAVCHVLSSLHSVITLIISSNPYRDLSLTHSVLVPLCRRVDKYNSIYFSDEYVHLNF